MIQSLYTDSENFQCVLKVIIMRKSWTKVNVTTLLFFIFQLDPPPEFLASRQKLWDQLKKEYDDWVAAQERKDIKVTLPDGKVVEGMAWETTPYDVAKGIRYSY